MLQFRQQQMTKHSYSTGFQQLNSFFGETPYLIKASKTNLIIFILNGVKGREQANISVASLVVNSTLLNSKAREVKASLGSSVASGKDIF